MRMLLAALLCCCSLPARADEYLGSYNIDSPLTFSVTTRAQSLGAFDADADPAYRIYEDETSTAIASGTMAKLDDANTLGLYSEAITLASGTGYEKGKSYTIYISASVDGVTGTTRRTFQIGALTRIIDGTGAGEIDTSLGGVALADGAIAATKIADGAFTNAKFAVNAITASTLAADVTTEFQLDLLTDPESGLAAIRASVENLDDNLPEPVDATAINELRTWMASIDSASAGNIVTVKRPVSGPFAMKFPLNDGADINSFDSVTVTVPAGAGAVAASNLRKSADGLKAIFNLPSLTTAGTYTIVGTIGTLDGATLSMECKLIVR